MADTQSTAGSGDAPPEESVETELSRDRSLADITFIGVGAMIGAGVFALTGFAAGLAGPALTVAFVLNGLVAMFTAVSYAELGAAFPEAGGGYLWVKEALADPNGFYAGWMSWFAHAVACALYAVTFGVF
ncbi:amino acid permease, partial [Halobellus sp. Atlit-38R]|uniref:APC family permease n=1 Tax=Halobellus sp. Atlit-38R TaxID=2282131 RepID=UPI000EF26D1E